MPSSTFHILALVPLLIFHHTASGAQPPLNGWWREETANIININESDFSFGERWAFVVKGHRACALRYTYFGNEIVGTRVYNGPYKDRHAKMFRGKIIRGEYVDNGELAQHVPQDPYEFFLAPTILVLRLQIPGEERGRFMLLTRDQEQASNSDNNVLRKYCHALF